MALCCLQGGVVALWPHAFVPHDLLGYRKHPVVRELDLRGPYHYYTWEITVVAFGRKGATNPNETNTPRYHISHFSDAWPVRSAGGPSHAYSGGTS